MATKEELAKDCTEYVNLLKMARFNAEQGNHPQAIEMAILTFPYIDGMMQYERRYAQREFDTIESIEVILRYAPVVFVPHSLNAVESLLAEKKRINKNTQQDLKDKLATARNRLRSAHRLWNHIERHPDSRQDDLRKTLGGDQDEWRGIAEFWESIGLLRRSPESNSYRLRFVTNMDDAVVVKCPSCGVTGKAKKAKCLDLVVCPKCKHNVHFVMSSLP